MVFLISLILASAFAWFGVDLIKKHARTLYIFSAVVSVGVIAVNWSGLMIKLPIWFRNYIFPFFGNASFSCALFAVVMYTGALRQGGSAVKRLMPIRAELSIIASILTLGHNIGYGKTYFFALFTNPTQMKENFLWAAVCSVVLILIMLPLMITSFEPNRWRGGNRSRIRLTPYRSYQLHVSPVQYFHHTPM